MSPPRGASQSAWVCTCPQTTKSMYQSIGMRHPWRCMGSAMQQKGCLRAPRALASKPGRPPTQPTSNVLRWVCYCYAAATAMQPAHPPALKNGALPGRNVAGSMSAPALQLAGSKQLMPRCPSRKRFSQQGRCQQEQLHTTSRTQSCLRRRRLAAPPRSHADACNDMRRGGKPGRTAMSIPNSSPAKRVKRSM